MPKLQFKNGDIVVVPGSATAADFGEQLNVPPYPQTATLLTSNAALTTGGVYQLSGATATSQVTASLPSAASNLGVRYHIITTSAHAHQVTASVAVGGVANGIARTNLPGMTGAANSTAFGALSFGALLGHSFVVESNGIKLVTVALTSGSHTFTVD